MYLKVFYIMNESLARMYSTPTVCQALKICSTGEKADIVLDLRKLIECLLGRLWINNHTF